ncbi:hypothetical protein SAMN06297387_10225 [Streptomyces zhaozhouensis]|uniref:HEAT repeat-containing protein n=1 Tax=Streptomyces zhaozhouensis TaxID=1300267 RepID=A0A286DNM0_9ACTN|nr:hypothetical protein [Streptomyces zhaozhouensis]SOD60134.1 hypothetical protein SAMN06297387_10225 [Streptomyces zhaozhouensis]
MTVTSSGQDWEEISRIDASLPRGFLGENETERIRESFPDAPQRIVGWLRLLTNEEEWATFNRFALLAAEFAPPGLVDVLRPVLQAAPTAANQEGLVEILGDLADPAATSTVIAYFDRTWPQETPFYSSSVKALEALGAIGTEEAQSFLRSLAEDHGKPAPLRWYAAVELQIEDELGFDEDTMLASQ